MIIKEKRKHGSHRNGQSWIVVALAIGVLLFMNRTGILVCSCLGVPGAAILAVIAIMMFLFSGNRSPKDEDPTGDYEYPTDRHDL